MMNNSRCSEKHVKKKWAIFTFAEVCRGSLKLMFRMISELLSWPGALLTIPNCSNCHTHSHRRHDQCSLPSSACQSPSYCYSFKTKDTVSSIAATCKSISLCVRKMFSMWTNSKDIPKDSAIKLL